MIYSKLLPELIGREQFNFASGNYSKCDDKTLIEYLEKTYKLNYEDIDC